MSPLVIAAIAVLSVGVYALIAGVTVALCPEDLRESPAAVPAAMFWPITLPLMAGVWLVERVRSARRARVEVVIQDSRLPKAEVRRG